MKPSQVCKSHCICVGYLTLGILVCSSPDMARRKGWWRRDWKGNSYCLGATWKGEVHARGLYLRYRGTQSKTTLPKEEEPVGNTGFLYMCLCSMCSGSHVYLLITLCVQGGLACTLLGKISSLLAANFLAQKPKDRHQKHIQSAGYILIPREIRLSLS